jgi:hypothetical protein
MRAEGERALNNAPRTIAPTYDFSEWPIVAIRMPPWPLSPEALSSHLAAGEEPYRRGRPFGMLIIMGDHPPLPAVQRRAIAAAIKEHEAHYPGLNRGQAIVVRTNFERGIITAINWIAAPVHPMAAFTSVDAAKGWLARRLAGYEMSDAPRP